MPVKPSITSMLTANNAYRIFDWIIKFKNVSPAYIIVYTYLIIVARKFANLLSVTESQHSQLNPKQTMVSYRDSMTNFGMVTVVFPTVLGVINRGIRRCSIP